MPMGAGTRHYQRIPGRYMSFAGLHPQQGVGATAPVLPPGQNFANREAFLANQQGYHDQARQAYSDRWGSDEGWAQFDPTRGTFGDWAKGSERHEARTGARDAYYDFMQRQGGAGAGPVSQEDAMAYAMQQIGAPPGAAPPAVDPVTGTRQGGDRMGGQPGTLQDALMMAQNPDAVGLMQGQGKAGFDPNSVPQGKFVTGPDGHPTWTPDPGQFQSDPNRARPGTPQAGPMGMPGAQGGKGGGGATAASGAPVRPAARAGYFR